MPFIAAGASLLGGMMQADATQSAANTSAEAQRYAAQQAAEAAKFRPVGVTTRYGSSQFQTNPQGYLTGASYMGTPELQAMQDRIDAINRSNLGYAEQAGNLYSPLLGGAQSLYSQAGLGLKATPEQQAADYLQKQQALLAPSRERESALLANQLSNSGRTGLSVAQGGGLLSANPEQSALANARAMQDLQLAANATQAGQQQTAFGAGLFGQGAGLLGQYQQGQIGALSPFQNTLGVQSGIEQLGQNPLTLGAGLGGQAAAYGAQSGRFISQGAQAAAPMAYQAASYNPLANVLQGASTNPYFTQSMMQPYNQAQMAMGQYGSQNVYGYGGQGAQPTQSQWSNQWDVQGGI